MPKTLRPPAPRRRLTRPRRGRGGWWPRRVQRANLQAIAPIALAASASRARASSIIAAAAPKASSAGPAAGGGALKYAGAGAMGAFERLKLLARFAGLR
jgi:hypothetical protein